MALRNMRVDDLYMFLKHEGFDVYFPSQKLGDCVKEYIVVKKGESVPHLTFSSIVDIYLIMCYVPKFRYSDMEKLTFRVKKAMKKAYPLFIENGIETPSYYDDNIKAHMVSIEYKNYKKNYNLSDYY